MRWVRYLLTAVAVTSALSAAGLAVTAWRNQPPLRVLHVATATTDAEVYLTRRRLNVFAITWASPPITRPARAAWGVSARFRTAPPGVTDGQTLPPIVFGPDVWTRTWWGDRFGFGVSRIVPDNDRIRNGWVPAWAAVVILAVPAAAVSGTRLARRRRLGPGRCRCRRCGYDLRATPARCPECGATAERRSTGGAT